MLRFLFIVDGVIKLCVTASFSASVLDYGKHPL